MPERPAARPVRIRPVDPAEPGHTLARDGITSLDQLKAATMACRECPIGEFATQSVTGEGALHARLMLVGEQPGDRKTRRATAARSLLGRMVRVMAERGHWNQRADGRQVLVTLHPSALLRVNPEDRETAFAAFVHDLRQTRRVPR